MINFDKILKTSSESSTYSSSMGLFDEDDEETMVYNIIDIPIDEEIKEK